jgi:hypothetical protein
VEQLRVKKLGVRIKEDLVFPYMVIKAILQVLGLMRKLGG